jgi:cytochrome c-type biogenesis protein
MSELFASLTRAVEGVPGVALGASLVWGVLSIILSPCHLASIPLIVAFIGGQGGATTTRRAFGLSLAFGVGILVTIAVIGAVTAALGRMMGDVGSWANWLVAGVMLLVGLHLLGVIPLPVKAANVGGFRATGYLAALVLGLVFGIALGPCTFAYMAPMLAVALKVAGTAPVYGATMLLAYGVGHCAVIVAAGASTSWVQKYLDWSSESKGATVARSLCGVLVILGGLYMVYIAR